MNAKTPKIFPEPRKTEVATIQRNIRLTSEEDNVLIEAMKKSGWDVTRVFRTSLLLYAPSIGVQAERCNELFYHNLCSIQAALAIHKPNLPKNKQSMSNPPAHE